MVGGAEDTSQELRAEEGDVRANGDDVGFSVEVVDRGHFVRAAVASLQAFFRMVSSLRREIMEI